MASERIEKLLVSGYNNSYNFDYLWSKLKKDNIRIKRGEHQTEHNGKKIIGEDFAEYIKKNPFVTKENCSANIFDLYGEVIRVAILDYKLWNDTRSANQKKYEKYLRAYRNYLKIPTQERKKKSNNNLQKERLSVLKNFERLHHIYINYLSADNFLFDPTGLERIIIEFNINLNINTIRRAAKGQRMMNLEALEDTDGNIAEIGRVKTMRVGRNYNINPENVVTFKPMSNPAFLKEQYNID